MKTEKIEELFYKHALYSDYNCGCDMDDWCECEQEYIYTISDFTKAINQAEKENKLEWYKKLEHHLSQMIERENFAYDVRFYCEGIQNKIKELEK
jgi:hypothetical protein